MLYPFTAIAEMIIPILAGEIPAEDEETTDADEADAEPADADAATTDDSEPADSKDELKPADEAEDEEGPEDEEEAVATDERDTASWLAEVKSLRAENKKRRLSERDKEAKIQEFEAAKLKAERSKMAEVDRLKAEKADLEVENAEKDAMLAQSVKMNIVESVAAGLGFQDTTDAVTMLGNKFEQIVIATDGSIDRDEVMNMLTDLLDSKPYLKKVTETEQKLKKVRTAATNTPSDAKVQSKIGTKTDDEEAITQEIAELNQAGEGGKAWRVYLQKRILPARKKLKETLFSSE